MQITQNRSVFLQQDHHASAAAPMHWPLNSASPRDRAHRQDDPMANRVHQPLVFSIDDRLAEQHLTRLDLPSKNLRRIEPLPNGINFNSLNYDRNEITRLEHIDALPQLVQLSIAHNRLVDIRLLYRLRSLQKLNLSYNVIDSVDSLRMLQNLVMLNISNNNLANLSPLNTCRNLQSLDASCNSIQQIEDLSQLTSLKYLNLHKNFIDSLAAAPRHWPKTLHTLVISDNEIQDLTEIYYLSSFIDLNTLYIIANPCLSVVDERHGCHQPFDYRPYVLNWCLALHNLDGIFITRKESLKAEWLLSQGKGRAFRSGEHDDLVQYLIRVCGTDANERDDLHLSRIMVQQDVYQQPEHSHIDEIYSYEPNMAASDTMRDAYETLSTNTEGRFRTSTATTESEASRDKITSVVSPRGEVRAAASSYQQPRRTPSPGYSRYTTAARPYLEDTFTENSSSNRYSEYDNRPIKPLDQHMLRTKLNEYPEENVAMSQSSQPRTRSSTNAQLAKRGSSQLAYNANRYSPKTTVRGPTASVALHARSSKTLARHSVHRLKRHTRTSTNSNVSQLTDNSTRNRTSAHLTTAPGKPTTKERQASINASNDNKNQSSDDDDDDDGNVQLTTAPGDPMLLTPTGPMNNSIELQKLTTSVETMRASILQAYVDLHERFTKTTELQTSALTALWQKCETQNFTHQRETETLLRENQLLNQRIRELELRVETKETKSTLTSSNPCHPTIQTPASLAPPLRAHISKRDARSFFLHWIPNPLNGHRKILGYRIYIDDRLKGAMDPGRFEAIIDYIRDEGEYRIKIRTYDENGESADSNIVVARFRRQHSIKNRSESNPSDPTTSEDAHRNANDYIIDDAESIHLHGHLVNYSREETRQPIILDKRTNDDDIVPLDERQQNTSPLVQRHATPERTSSDDLISPISSSPVYSNYINIQENIISRKPPKSPTSSPGRADRLASNHDSCSKVLFTNSNHQADVSSIRTAKRSPTRTGIMSRLAKSPYRVQRPNNALLNALPSENISSANNQLNAQPNPTSEDQGHGPDQQMSTELTATSAPIPIPHPAVESARFQSNSSPSSPPPPLPPRIARAKN